MREMTGGLGPEVALECSGDAAALGQCVAMLRKGGRVAVIGIPHEDAAIPLQRVVLDEIEIAGVRAAAGEMPEIINLVAAGRVRLAGAHHPRVLARRVRRRPTRRSPSGSTAR